MADPASALVKLHAFLTGKFPEFMLKVGGGAVVCRDNMVEYHRAALRVGDGAVAHGKPGFPCEDSRAVVHKGPVHLAVDVRPGRCAQNILGEGAHVWATSRDRPIREQRTSWVTAHFPSLMILICSRIHWVSSAERLYPRVVTT